MTLEEYEVNSTFASQLTDTSVLITGGAGFIGSHLTHTLVPTASVTVFDDYSMGDPDHVPDNATFIQADIRNRDALADAMSDIDILFHQAGLVSVPNELYGLETVALRYFNVYGPGQRGGNYAGVITAFLAQARRGTDITVHGDGSQTRDFVHAKDIVQANIRAALSDVSGRSYNIGTGQSVTIRRLAELVREIADSNSEIIHTEPREGDVAESVIDISHAIDELDYEPTIELQNGLHDLIGTRI